MSNSSSPTRALAGWVAECPIGNISESTFQAAQHTVLDWLGVALAGASDHLVNILVAEALADGAQGNVNLIGRSEKVSTSAAALINGVSSHVLDYDDVNRQMHGHPSVTVLPAVWALAEQQKRSGRAFLEAFIIGYETACLVGRMLGDSHYEKGWHATATMGTLGAAAGAARLLSLDTAQTTAALGIAATQAAGLKAVFGSMCKPLHAGKAAMNGLMAARWAKRGMTSADNIIEARQGLAHTQSTSFNPIVVERDYRPKAVESALFKYHACCYFTHAALEALLSLRETHQLQPDAIRSVQILAQAGHQDACDIIEPRTDLEIKFSIRHLAAMVLSGLDTSDLDVYTRETANRPDLIALRQRIEFKPKKLKTRYVAEVVVKTTSDTFKATHDAGEPNLNRANQWRRLSAKFTKLAAPMVGPERTKFLIAIVDNLSESHQLSDLIEATQTSFVEL